MKTTRTLEEIKNAIINCCMPYDEIGEHVGYTKENIKSIVDGDA